DGRFADRFPHRPTLGISDRQKAHVDATPAANGALHSRRPLLEHCAAEARIADGCDELRARTADRHWMAEIRRGNRHGANAVGVRPGVSRKAAERVRNHRVRHRSSSGGWVYPDRTASQVEKRNLIPELI